MKILSIKIIENSKACVMKLKHNIGLKVKELPIFTRDPAIQEQRKTLAESTTKKMCKPLKIVNLVSTDNYTI